MEDYHNRFPPPPPPPHQLHNYPQHVHQEEFYPVSDIRYYKLTPYKNLSNYRDNASQGRDEGYFDHLDEERRGGGGGGRNLEVFEPSIVGTHIIAPTPTPAKLLNFKEDLPKDELSPSKDSSLQSTASPSGPIRMLPLKRLREGETYYERNEAERNSEDRAAHHPPPFYHHQHPHHYHHQNFNQFMDSPSQMTKPQPQQLTQSPKQLQLTPQSPKQLQLTPQSPKQLQLTPQSPKQPQSQPPNHQSYHPSLQSDPNDCPQTDSNDSLTPSTNPTDIDDSRTDVYFTVLEQPLKHQVKEFNILPSGVLRLMKHYQPLPADYFLVKLLCDAKMEKGEIFLAAVSAHSHSNGEIVVPSVKVSQKMLPGRTKGYSFRILYELVVDSKVLQREVTDEFFLWSNVNQCGYPRKEREAILNQRIESNKTKVKPKGRTPGRPKKKESDKVDFDS